ncbi:MAG TPA: dihydrodipicolinate synthase family protein [Fimbriimonadaceae bacterium]|nr:dihydrodipicolinate synthase family protein [Fimbriimonadaceae bacterium]
MLKRGVYPASVTPMTGDQRLDEASLGRLLNRFTAAGCAGVVLAGTNGEGPSLSNPEKLELLKAARSTSGLDCIMGVATNSSSDAADLCVAAAEGGAIGALVLPPGYYKDVSEDGLEAWYRVVFERSPIPLLVYNFPQRSGVTFGGEMLERLGKYPRFAGAKDSSGNPENLPSYREALPDEILYVGDETLLLTALELGWSGSISGAANVYPAELVQVVKEFDAGDHDGAAKVFAELLPKLKELRSCRQPATNKARLHAAGVLASPAVRAPLTAAAM